ncbi:hypothetical protein B0W47_16725 (plasmid) [Komagataeibacter nataicola]|uniref:Uncharacterized protein n=1 Tax=Komagataeibacter nataicola TaxID=265960 RepID=A0A9N7CK26_9PROT|nr:hypothetical protein B0W47_16725 [Komagataeibacter nataicola]PYD66260.1 hypothetical protein CDI09_08925 [Komagataeibacter nataicola]
MMFTCYIIFDCHCLRFEPVCDFFKPFGFGIFNSLVSFFPIFFNESLSLSLKGCVIHGIKFGIFYVLWMYSF